MSKKKRRGEERGRERGEVGGEREEWEGRGERGEVEGRGEERRGGRGESREEETYVLKCGPSSDTATV